MSFLQTLREVLAPRPSFVSVCPSCSRSVDLSEALDPDGRFGHEPVWGCVCGQRLILHVPGVA